MKLNPSAVMDVPKLEPHEVTALQMTANPKENATPEQQALAIQTIIGKICVVDVQPIQFGAPDETGFLNGRVFVGKEILRTQRVNVGEMNNAKQRDQVGGESVPANRTRRRR